MASGFVVLPGLPLPMSSSFRRKGMYRTGKNSCAQTWDPHVWRLLCCRKFESAHAQIQAMRKQGHIHIAQQIVLHVVLCDMPRQEELWLLPINGWRGSRVSNFARYLGSDLAGSLWSEGCCGCW